MRYIVAIAAILFTLTRAAWADTYNPYADLVCDPAKNIALARFIYAHDSDLPQYAKLPVDIDGKLSNQPGTGRRGCVLANGWEIKLRNGEAQAFAYGAGGAAPPDFFSLWVNHHKVFSKQNWSEQVYSGSEAQIAGVVVTPSNVTICEWKNGTDKPLTCEAKPLDLNRYKVDTVEYPPDFIHARSPGYLDVTASTSDGWGGCNGIIQHGPNDEGAVRAAAGEPDLPVAAKDIDWIDEESHLPQTPWPSISSLKNVFGLQIEEDIHVRFAPEPVDFDGDGNLDTVVEREEYRGPFEGSYFFVAPAKIPVIDVLRALYAGRGENIDDDIKRAEALGWHVYSGGRPGLYPKLSPESVHIDRIWWSEDYLLAYPSLEDADPTAIVIKPKADGTFETVCTIQRPRLNY